MQTRHREPDHWWQDQPLPNMEVTIMHVSFSAVEFEQEILIHEHERTEHRYHSKARRRDFVSSDHILHLLNSKCHFWTTLFLADNFRQIFCASTLKRRFCWESTQIPDMNSRTFASEDTHIYSSLVGVLKRAAEKSSERSTPLLLEIFCILNQNSEAAEEHVDSRDKKRSFSGSLNMLWAKANRKDGV